MSWTAEMVEKELSQRADALDETADVKLFETVMEQTTCYFKVGNFERALDRSMELSAIATKLSIKEVEEECRAAIKHNLATALHHIGAFEAAKFFYTKAYYEMEAAPETHGCMCFCSSPRAEQLAFMATRALLLDQNQKPEVNSYLNEHGKEGEWRQIEIDAATKLIAEFEPLILASGGDKKMGDLKTTRDATPDALNRVPDAAKSSIKIDVARLQARYGDAIGNGHKYDGNGGGGVREMI